MEALSHLSVNSSPAPDNIPAVLLKTCKEELSYPLYTLFTNSLDSGKIPEILKEGIVTPIFKGGSQGQAKNHRPAVLTSHIMKTMERIVRKNE